MTDTLELQLAKTQKKLKQLEEEYKDFANVVSHDLSGPLRSIDGFSSIILKDHGANFDAKTKRHFSHIIAGSEKGKEMLTALLAFSRLNSLAEPFSEVDCNALLAEVIAELSGLIDQASANINIAEMPIIQADAVQVKQVFYQVLKNALTYQTEGNQPHITVDMEEKSESWQFCVTDNGIGIKPSLFDKIFKPLRRGVKDKDYAGIGMGLANAKKILQRHQGDIWVEQKADVGASFSFTIAKELHNV